MVDYFVYINYMSATLDLNPTRVVSWKGLTIKQVNSKILKNEGQVFGNKNFFRANPVKLPRRELLSASNTTCNSRVSVKIDNINAPGGTTSNSSGSNIGNSISLTNEIQVPNNSCEYPGTCNTYTSPVDNARRRVRSSGMVRQKYHETSNNKSYHTNTKEYLHSRNMTYKQNQLVLSNPDNTCFKTHYSPSNEQFSVQGAVSSGDLITRKRYNTITDSAASYTNPLGRDVANALSYGVSSTGYTKKDKLGYPMKVTPTFSKYSDVMKRCSVTKLTNAI